MSCCSTQATDRFFSRTSKKYARNFRRKGLDKTQMVIADALVRFGIENRSILEIGCGVGGLHLVLLENGAAKACGVDVAKEMTEKAAVFASQKGLSDRVEYHVGDFLHMNGLPAPADVVILDKVLCCSHTPVRLIEKSIAKATKFYVVSYPADKFIPRLMFATTEFFGKVLNWSFHPWYHRPELLEEEITQAGFRQVFSQSTVVWQVKIFERAED